jgi:hypothetical protein
VFDITGKMVCEIVNGKHAASTYQLNWNTLGNHGSQLPGGLYFIKLIAGHSAETQKIHIVR